MALAWALLVERVRGIEPPLSAWEADVLPLNYTRGRPRCRPGRPRQEHTWSIATRSMVPIVTDVLHTVIWFELWVTDIKRAKTFYGELFGWTFRAMAEYDPDYWLIDAGELRGTIGALWPTDVEPTDSGAVVYVAVTDLPDVVARAVHLGGTLVREPTEVGDGSSFALIRDPGGLLLGLWARDGIATVRQ